MWKFLEGDSLGQLENQWWFEIIGHFVWNYDVLVCECDFSLEFGLGCFWEKSLEKFLRMIKGT